MASLLYQQIEGLSREKGIDPRIVVSAVEDAVAVATRKNLKSQENLRGALDKDTGAIEIYAVKSVVEAAEQVEDANLQIPLEEARKVDENVQPGGEVRFHRASHALSSPSSLGRISAQIAKQVIFQKVREAERDTVYNEYIGRVGEIVNATVKRIEGPDVIFDVGKTEARMPRKEQSRLESFAVGERVRVVIARVERASKGPGLVVSRAAPELVQTLFQSEVPEIYDGTVVIRAIAREAGERTKIAVMSKDKDVDSVGACVGMKGMRVQSIIRELRGEKIDIIEYHEDPVTFAEKALQPAKVSRVSVVDSAEKHLEVIVDDSQLSLAIGKKGQNVRLAAKLLGWKIDIKSEEEKRQEVELQMSALVGTPATPLENITDLGEGLLEKLAGAGVTTVEALADMTPEQLEAIPGIGPKTIEKISLVVNNYFSSLESQPGPVEGAGEGENLEAPPAGEIEAEIKAEENQGPVVTEITAALDELPPDVGSSADEYTEDVNTGQALEAAAISGVEDAPPADEAEVHTHGEERAEEVKPEETPEE